MGRDNGPFDVQALTAQEESNLVQRVFLTSGRGTPHVVVFSGVGHGNGCSRICARSGEILASQGQESVCVVDAAVVRPSLHQYFGVDNRLGWADALVQPGPIRHFARPTSQPGLWLLPGGSPAQELSACLKRDRLRSRLADLRAEFNYILIDAPPANLYVDAMLLPAMADGVILVLEAYTTRREAARKTKEDLEAAGIRLVGAVLNKRTFPVPEALYRQC